MYKRQIEDETNEMAPLARYFDTNTDDFTDSLLAVNNGDSSVVQLQVSSPANDPDNPDAEDYDWVNENVYKRQHHPGAVSSFERY